MTKVTAIHARRRYATRPAPHTSAYIRTPKNTPRQARDDRDVRHARQVEVCYFSELFDWQ
jgi:hypothetical protein